MIFSAILFIATWAHAVVELKLPHSFSDCSFLSTNDPYHFQATQEALQSLLTQKIKGSKNCQATMVGIQSGLKGIQDLYSNLDPSKQNQIAADVYTRYLADLNTEITTLQANLPNQSSDQQAFTQVRLQTLMSASDSANRFLQDNQISLRWYQYEYQNNQESAFRSQLIGYSNSLLQALTTADPQCVNQIGGWENILGAALGAASAATGISGMVAGPLVSAVGELLSNLVVALKDIRTQVALDRLLQGKNSMVVMCSYMALTQNACEFSRSASIAQNPALILQYLNSQRSLHEATNAKNSNAKFNPNETVRLYRRHFAAASTLNLLSQIFDDVAKIASPISADLGMLSQYLEAAAIDWDTLPNPPAAGAPEDQVLAWLNTVRTKGITIPTMDRFTGTPLSTADQFKAAMDLINNRRNAIPAIESILDQFNSFPDIVAKMKTRCANGCPQILKTHEYLSDLIAGKQKVNANGDTLPESAMATVRTANQLIAYVVELLYSDIQSTGCSVQPTDQQLKCYQDELKKIGRRLFAALADGAVAQIQRQNIIAIGGKGTNRIRWAFQTLENVFKQDDVRLKRGTSDSFSEFVARENGVDMILQSLSYFSPNKTMLRDYHFDLTLRSFEDGFQREILRLTRQVLRADTSQYADADAGADGSTAPAKHIQGIDGVSPALVCALYAPTLKKTAQGRALLKTCQERYEDLPTNALSAIWSGNGQPIRVPIDWNDPCFYRYYLAVMRSQELLLANPEFLIQATH